MDWKSNIGRDRMVRLCRFRGFTQEWLHCWTPVLRPAPERGRAVDFGLDDADKSPERLSRHMMACTDLDRFQLAGPNHSKNSDRMDPERTRGFARLESEAVGRDGRAFVMSVAWHVVSFGLGRDAGAISRFRLQWLTSR